MVKKPKNQTPSLPELINAVKPQTVTGMVKRINKALEEREAFERLKAPHSAHIEFRRARSFLANNRGFAAFLCALNVDPDHLLNRVRKDGYRANLKGVRKLKNLYQYVTGKTRSFERVSLALFASSIVAAKRGINWINNNEQELILSSLPVSSLPDEVQEAIKDYQHKYMRIEGDSRNQACQFRTTYDNLGCYFVSRDDVDDSNRQGIHINLDSPVIQFLSKKWELERII
jgi:hypothetical protein